MRCKHEPHLGQLEEGHSQDGEERQGGEGLGGGQLVAQQDVGGEGQHTDQRRDGVQDEPANSQSVGSSPVRDKSDQPGVMLAWPAFKDSLHDGSWHSAACTCDGRARGSGSQCMRSTACNTLLWGGSRHRMSCATHPFVALDDERLPQDAQLVVPHSVDARPEWLLQHPRVGSGHFKVEVASETC